MKRLERYILRFINNLDRKSDNNGSYVSISKSDFKKFHKITEKQFFESLNMLLEKGVIKNVVYLSHHKDLSVPIKVYTNDLTSTYLTNKLLKILEKAFSGTWDFIKFIIPTTIATIALIVSIIALIIQ